MRSANTALSVAKFFERVLLIVVLIGSVSALLEAQSPSGVDGTTIHRDVSHVVFQASSRRALESAARAISNEYGWTVDYEETSIAPSDVEDIAPADWKAAHPSQAGVLVPKQEDILLALPNDHPLREWKDKPTVMKSLVAASTLDVTFQQVVHSI